MWDLADASRAHAILRAALRGNVARPRPGEVVFRLVAAPNAAAPQASTVAGTSASTTSGPHTTVGPHRAAARTCLRDRANLAGCRGLDRATRPAAGHGLRALANPPGAWPSQCQMCHRPFSHLAAAGCGCGLCGGASRPRVPRLLADGGAALVRQGVALAAAAAAKRRWAQFAVSCDARDRRRQPDHSRGSRFWHSRPRPIFHRRAPPLP
mmetsp:Transcript_101800/g.287158  ORF Transcript_101800/g.287158 Transcript_101800/m.287158 type:complete len:210 (-) Transcript_101800:102-731(-)